MRKKVLYGKDARKMVLDGLNKIADAVCVTLGPSGRNVLISQSLVIDYDTRCLPIEVSKDGFKVTQRFEVEDPFEKVGVMMAKECAEKTVLQAGDGTSTTVLLLRAIVSKGVELVDAGANPMDLKRGIDKAVEYVVEELKKMATPIKGNIERIRQIATVSANNDPEIGDWIAKAFEKIGDEGVIDLEPSTGVSTEIKLSDGYKWSNGWISPYFVNKPEKQICEFDNPLILLYEKRINHHTQVKTVMEAAIKKGRPVLIVCEDADSEGLSFLALNNVQKAIQVCVVKAPAFGNDRRLEMEDLAILTGGTYISDTKGVAIKDAGSPHFGQARKVVVTKEETIIIGGVSDKGAVENLLNELRMNLAQAKNEDEKAPIEKRIAKITGGVAVIQVGAATETEMKEKLDRFDDSVRAVKSAIAEGFVAGGGTAFRNCRVFDLVRKSLSKDGAVDGMAIINEVMNEPLIQICKNSGVNSEEISKNLSLVENMEKGYNAKTGKICDLIESGIIDPVKVLRCALQNAASSAGMILTSEVLIVDYLN